MFRIRLIVLALLAVPLTAHAAGLHFERIGAESGPPPGVVTAVYEDRAGFIWIGSRAGLFLYDGYSFTSFEHDASDPSSLSGNEIRAIYEDSRGTLWIGTNTGGLNRFDRTTWAFEQFRHDPGDATSLSHDSVYTILEDKDGILWVGTQRGLNRFDRATGVFEQILADPEKEGALRNDYVVAILEDRAGRLWVGTVEGGLYLRDRESDRFRAYRHDPRDPNSLGNDSVLALAEDSAGVLWVGTSDGLNRMSRDGVFERFDHDPVGPTGLSAPLVTSLAPGPAGKLWIGTWGGGLNELDTVTGTLRVERHVPGRPGSLGSDTIAAMAVDRTGALWLATWGGGLNRLSTASRFLRASRDDAPLPERAGSDITVLMQDSRGGLWVGLGFGAVLRKAPGETTYRQYLRGEPDGIARIILAFSEDAAGNVWVGTNQNLVRIEPESGHVTEGKPGPDSPGPGFIKALLVDSKDRLWVGTGEGGLQQADPDGRVIERFVTNASDPHSLSDVYVTALFEDREGTIWVGTRSGGLNAFDPETGRAVRYVPDPGNDSAIGHQYVTSILEDSKGRLWVGTSAGGLNLAERRDDGGGVQFTRFLEQDGLIDNSVMAILEDDDGSLWLSTKHGLSRFDPERRLFANFHMADGLPAAEFEPRSAARNGQSLFFGSVKGIATLPAGTPFQLPEASPTVITSLSTEAGEFVGERPIWLPQQVEIPYGEWLSLEIAVLDYSPGENRAYAYRLGDEREPWVELGARRAVTFTDLNPGTFEFSARARNSQGVWSEVESKLSIRVVPPFWMTSWFRASMLLLVLAAVVAIHTARMSILEKRNRELLRLHEQREHARMELSGAYARLRALTRKLEMSKEDERRRIARELHDELGPSLTAVIINMQLLTKSPDQEQRSQRITDTIELVDRMIDRIRDLSLELRPPLIEELGLVSALSGYLTVQAERTGLQLEVDGDCDVTALSPEIQIVAFRVVQAAVTNVIRHAGATRAVVTLRQAGGNLEMIVEDDGRGFDVGKTMDGAVRGKALGILGTRERVQMLGGEFEIESRPGSGTKMWATIPVEMGP